MGSTSKAVGAWKGFIIRLITEDDLVHLGDFLAENFHPDEPMGKFVPPDEDFVKVTTYKMEQIVKNHKDICLVAVDADTGKIAGCQLQFIWKKSDAFNQKTQAAKSPISPYKTRRFMDAIYAPMDEKRYGLFDTFGVSEVVWNFAVSTGRKYRGIGLSSELYARMVALLKEKGHKVVYSIFSSPFSRKAAAAVGFKEIARSYFSQTKDQNGDSFVSHATGEEDFAAVMVLDLTV